MIDALVDAALVTLLSSVPGLHVVAGLQDNEPALETPYCAVYSTVQKTECETPIYELLTTIEYNTISGPDSASHVKTTVTAIDELLNSQPALAITGLQFLGWQHIERTQQNVGDRRRIVRELKVIAV